MWGAISVQFFLLMFHCIFANVTQFCCVTYLSESWRTWKTPNYSTPPPPPPHIHTPYPWLTTLHAHHESNVSMLLHHPCPIHPYTHPCIHISIHASIRAYMHIYITQAWQMIVPPPASGFHRFPPSQLSAKNFQCINMWDARCGPK